jgi:hypothetical protein
MAAAAERSPSTRFHNVQTTQRVVLIHSSEISKIISKSRVGQKTIADQIVPPKIKSSCLYHVQ